MQSQLNCSTGSKAQRETLKNWILENLHREVSSLKKKFHTVLKQVSILRSLGLSKRSSRIVLRLASLLKLFYGVNHMWVCQSAPMHSQAKSSRFYFRFLDSGEICVILIMFILNLIEWNLKETIWDIIEIIIFPGCEIEI